MIFTREQWQEVYHRYRCATGISETTRPSAAVLAILELDALEHGIHQTWIDFWIDGTNYKWANVLYVMLHYKPGRYGDSAWGKPK